LQLAADFTVTSEIYLDVSHGRKPLGRITLGLFGDEAPKTVENFRHICLNGIDGLSYNGTRFHRVIYKFMIQGGDILKGDGAGSLSIFGKHFEDENLTINLTAPGFLGMANHGPDSNGCQFFITTVPAPWLNGKHTIFGKAVNGQEWAHVIERVKTTTDDEPAEAVVITACGELKIDRPYTINDLYNYDIWGWIKSAAVPVTMSFIILSIFRYFIKMLDKVA
jgi:peptidyl-prolyl cis-trans isomerase B (cyclophilin B)